MATTAAPASTLVDSMVRTAARRARWLRSALVLLGYLGLAAWLDAGALSDPLHTTVDGGHGDAGIFMWFLASTAHALWHGDVQGLLVTHNLNYPAGVNAMWNTGLLLPSLVLSPVTSLAGPGLSLLVIFYLGPPLSAWSAYLSSAPFLRSQQARIITGLFFGFSPAVMAAQLGHFQLTLLMLVPPIVLLGVDSLTQRRTPRRTGLLLGASLGCQLLVGEEVLALSCIAVGALLVTLAVQYPERATATVRPFRAAAGWALLPAALIGGYPLAVQLLGPQRVHGSLQPPDRYDLDPVGLIVPPDTVRLHAGELTRRLHPLALDGIEQLGYLGLPLLILLIAVVIRQRQHPVVRTTAISAALLAALSLGPTLHLAGRATGLPMPWQLTNGWPLIANLLPARFMLVIDLLVALLIGQAVDHLPQRLLPRLSWLALLGLSLLAVLPSPPAAALRTGTPRFFTTAGKNLHGTVLVLPYVSPPHTVAMTWVAEAGAGFGMPGGYFVGPDPAGRAVFGTQPPRPFIRLLSRRHAAGRPPNATAHDRAVLRADLRYWHVDTIVLGPTKDRSFYRIFLTQCLRRPPTSLGGVFLWRHVLPVPGTRPSTTLHAVSVLASARGAVGDTRSARRQVR